MGRLIGLLQRLRAAGGKGLADVITVAVVAILATAAALFLNMTTPIRYVENLSYDLRLTGGAPAAQPEFVIVKIDSEATKAMSEASDCHCLAPIDKILKAAWPM